MFFCIKIRAHFFLFLVVVSRVKTNISILCTQKTKAEFRRTFCHVYACHLSIEIWL